MELPLTTSNSYVITFPCLSNIYIQSALCMRLLRFVRHVITTGSFRMFASSVLKVARSSQIPLVLLICCCTRAYHSESCVL